MTTLKVEVFTPEAALWSGEARALVARSSEGDFTVLPQHTAMVGDLVPGIVRVESSEGEFAFCVHGGYFQVGAAGEGVTLATVLAGVAERTTEIDVARAQAAKERLEALIGAEGRGDADPVTMAEARAALDRAELRLRAAGR